MQCFNSFKQEATVSRSTSYELMLYNPLTLIGLAGSTTALSRDFGSVNSL
jgi:hypothetical protein